MAEDKMTALEREVRLLREGFDKLAGVQRQEIARAERRHREAGEKQLEHFTELGRTVERLASALQEYNDGRRGPGNGPAPVSPLRKPGGGKGSHRA